MVHSPGPIVLPGVPSTALTLLLAFLAPSLVSATCIVVDPVLYLRTDCTALSQEKPGIPLSGGSTCVLVAPFGFYQNSQQPIRARFTSTLAVCLLS